MSGAGGAGEALAAAARSALVAVGDFSSVQERGPLQAAIPHALVEADVETDWGHKSGAGREVRLSVTIRDSGELAARLRKLAVSAEAALAAIGPVLPGWRIVNLRFVQSHVARDGSGWTALLRFRARMRAEG